MWGIFENYVKKTCQNTPTGTLDPPTDDDQSVKGLKKNFLRNSHSSLGEVLQKLIFRKLMCQTTLECQHITPHHTCFVLSWSNIAKPS